MTWSRSARARTWGWPLALATGSAIGLAFALVGDGAWDAASWIALGAPVAACAWFGVRRPSVRR